MRAFVRLDVAQPPSRDRRDGPRRMGWIATCRLITYPTAGEAPGSGPILFWLNPRLRNLASRAQILRPEVFPCRLRSFESEKCRMSQSR